MIRYTVTKIVSVMISILVIQRYGFAQSGMIYKDLPVGKYTVGFKVFTLTDETRIVKPEYNYFGEKNQGDRRMKITVHLWYPAKANTGKERLTYGSYCYNDELKTTGGKIGQQQKEEKLNSRRRSTENWFGKTTDEAWKKLLEAPMLAQSDAEPVKEKFPLLIGSLRPLSTSVTNEMLASNGYVVAMVNSESTATYALATLDEITDMRFVMAYLHRNPAVDSNNIGTFGFSGSGFSQVLLAMNDFRIKAVADIESGIYMDNLFQNFSASHYYQPHKLRVPFLHIFSLDLSKQEKFISEFESKTTFSKRYRLLLNQPGLHHWDVAAEGYTSTIFLNNRGAQSASIRQSFEIASVYLLNFFNSVLKKSEKATAFLTARPKLKETRDSLWSIAVLADKKPAPDWEEFQAIVKVKGLDDALAETRNALREDTLSDLMKWYYFNGFGYSFLNEKKYKEAIKVFELNTELHPEDPNLFDSLAEAYELAGDKEKMKMTSSKALEILNRKTSLSDFEKGLKGNAEKRLQ